MFYVIESPVSKKKNGSVLTGGLFACPVNMDQSGVPNGAVGDLCAEFVPAHFYFIGGA